MRVQKSYSPYTSDRGPYQLMHCKSTSHLQTPILSRFGPSSCSLTDLFGILRPTDPSTQHLTQHTFLIVTSTQIHQRKSSCFIHRSYIHPESTGIVFPTQILTKHKSLIIPQVCVPSLSLLAFCNMSSTTYQT